MYPRSDTARAEHIGNCVLVGFSTNLSHQTVERKEDCEIRSESHIVFFIQGGKFTMLGVGSSVYEIVANKHTFLSAWRYNDRSTILDDCIEVLEQYLSSLWLTNLSVMNN
jgi:hypothetical protein